MAHLKVHIERVAEPLVKDHGILLFKMLSYWPIIVGQRMSDICTPYKLVFPFQASNNGVLHLQVSNPGFGLELQAKEGWLLDRISSYFGYKIIVRLKIVVNARRVKIPKQPEYLPMKQPKEALPVAIDNTLSSIQDDELRAVLESIARHL